MEIMGQLIFINMKRIQDKKAARAHFFIKLKVDQFGSKSGLIYVSLRYIFIVALENFD